MPILDSHTIEFFSRSPEQTRRIGMRLGSELKTGDVICLQGNLGAGKTTFVQGLAQEEPEPHFRLGGTAGSSIQPTPTNQESPEVSCTLAQRAGA